MSGRAQRAAEKLAAYNEVDEAQHQELLTIVAAWREDHGEEIPVIFAQHIDSQQRMADRLAAEMQRLGTGAVALRDKWAESDDPSLNAASQELHNLLCGKENAS